MKKDMSWMSFDELEFVDVTRSNLTRDEELVSIIPVDAKEKKWIGLWTDEVRLKAVKDCISDSTTGVSGRDTEEIELDDPVAYWNGIKIISFQEIKNWRIIENKEEIWAYRVKGDHDTFFTGSMPGKESLEDGEKGSISTDELPDPSTVDIDGIKTSKHISGGDTVDDHAIYARKIHFDGSNEEDFLGFFSYVEKRLCGESPGQKSRKPPLTPPLISWREGFDKGVVDFSKTRIIKSKSSRLKGYVGDYLDYTKRKIIKENKKKLKGGDDAESIMGRIHRIIEGMESDEISKDLYMYLLPILNGKSIRSIKSILRVSEKEIMSTIVDGIDTLAKIILDDIMDSDVGLDDVMLEKALDVIRAELSKELVQKPFPRLFETSDKVSDYVALGEESGERLKRDRMSFFSQVHDVCNNLLDNAWYFSMSDKPLVDWEIEAICNRSQQFSLDAINIDRLLLIPEVYEGVSDHLEISMIQEYHNGPLTIPFKNRIKALKNRGGFTWAQLAENLGVYSWRNLNNLINYRKNARTKNVNRLFEAVNNLEKEVEGGEYGGEPK
jgi:hypothetical protein